MWVAFSSYSSDVILDFLIVFFLQSPTAIIFSNRVVFENNRFFAKIYGTDSSAFTAEMHIYGTEYWAADVFAAILLTHYRPIYVFSMNHMQN